MDCFPYLGLKWFRFSNGISGIEKFLRGKKRHKNRKSKKK